MDRREYMALRSELGQALRDLRWERRAIDLIFRKTRDPDLIQAGLDWLGELVARDISLSREIIALDVRYKLEG